MNYEEYVEKLAMEIMNDVSMEKEAAEGKKRIDSLRDHYNTDEFSQRGINRQIDRAEGRRERANLKDQIKQMKRDGKDPSEIQVKLQQAKGKRNEHIKGHLKDSINIPAQYRAAQGTLAAGGMGLGITPGATFDNQAAQTLAIKDTLDRRQKKVASYYEEAQMIKQAADEAYLEAQAMEDASIEVLAELGYEFE